MTQKGKIVLSKSGINTAKLFIILMAACIVVFLLGLFMGSAQLSFQEVWSTLWQPGKTDSPSNVLIWGSRMPRVISAMLIGSSLAISGLLMQTFFRNPIAGPYILGVSSGASLGVALVILGGLGASLNQVLSESLFLQHFSIRITAALLGAALSVSLVLALAEKVKDSASLLIGGLMIGTLSASISGILQYFSTQEALRDFIFWTFGSLDHLHWNELRALSLLFLPVIFVALIQHRRWDAMLLGTYGAQSLGYNPATSNRLILLLSAALAALSTAYCGPIAFVGMAVPHLIRLYLGKTRHIIMIPACILGGAFCLLLCDLIARLPGYSASLPINAVSALFGAPVLIFAILQRGKLSNYF
jgi:iron complex transport system permease protein